MKQSWSRGRRRTFGLLIVLGGIALILGGLGSAIGLGNFLSRQNEAFARIAQTVKGTVIDFEVRNDDFTSYAPVVQFATANGDTIQFISSVSQNPPAYKIGSAVDVLYDPANPQHAEISGSMNVAVLIVTAVGFVLALFGVVMVIGGILIMRDADRQKTVQPVPG